MKCLRACGDIRSSARYRTHVMARLLYHDLRDFWGKRG